MGAYGLPSGACQPCPPIGGCSATNLCHNLLWTGLAVPISSKGGALDVPHLDVRIGYGRAGILAVAGVFALTLRTLFSAPVRFFACEAKHSGFATPPYARVRC